MKKQDLATLAMIGISAGLLVGGCQQNQKDKKPGANGANFEKIGTNMQTFMNSLPSEEARKKFMQLDNEHKLIVIEMVTQGCNGKNSCKGKGACATAEHACAGKNGCKGKGGGPIESADKAVNAQFENQMNGTQNQNNTGMRGSNRMQTSGVSGDLTPEMQDFYKRLSLEGQRKFLTLDAQHKMMAMHMVAQDCKGKNDCKGMGGCKTEAHACAGKNDCKGKGGRPIADVNKAVDTQYGNQANQRENMSRKVPNP